MGDKNVMPPRGSPSQVRKQADGSTRYTAIVRLRSGRTIVHQEPVTYPSALIRVQQGYAPRLGDLIRYISTRSKASRGGSGASRPTPNSKRFRDTVRYFCEFPGPLSRGVLVPSATEQA